LQVLEGAAFPNPSPQSIRLRLDGPADRLSLAIYTVNMQLVERIELQGAFSGGWVSVPLPQPLRDRMGAGSYFYQADARRDVTKALKPLVGTFVFLR
jgi:hypothetical protein